MTAPDTPALAGMSIGAVLDLLRGDFPDVTISKIRFLEAEGLVTPERTASGYRRFTAYDCARLRFVLTAQRDQYLPLKVIKAQLDAQSDGELPYSGSAYGVPRLVPVDSRSDTAFDEGTAGLSGVAPTQVRLRREDLLARSGVDEVLRAQQISSRWHLRHGFQSTVIARTSWPGGRGTAGSPAFRGKSGLHRAG